MLLFFMTGMLMAGPFQEGSLEDIFKKAREQEKLVLIDVYTTWCGPCKIMDRQTFKHDAVVEFLKNDVISYKIDAEKGEGPALAKKYKVAGYPCFLILDSDGKLVKRKMGFMPPRAFLNWAKDALN